MDPGLMAGTDAAADAFGLFTGAAAQDTGRTAGTIVDGGGTGKALRHRLARSAGGPVGEDPFPEDLLYSSGPARRPPRHPRRAQPGV